MMAAQPPDYVDVLIAGGGLVGTALAVAISGNKNLRVAVVEPYNFATASANPATNYDDRSVALAQGTRLIFEQLGIWQVLSPHCAAIKKIHISERGRFGATRLDAREEGVPALGYVVENRVLGNALLDAVGERENVTLIGGSKVVAAEQVADQINIGIARGGKQHECSARLLVAADGAQSNVRSLLGIETSEHDYQQSAIIANVSTENAHENIAYERFTDSGPLALLPLSNARCSMVMTVNAAQTEAIATMDETDFIALLQRRFGQRMGRFTQVGKRSHFPLKRVRADADCSGRALLLGNARHYLHPVSGQGFNLAMRDIGVLGELLGSDPCSDSCTDPGASELLSAFSARRRTDHKIVEHFTHTLAKLFTVPFPPLAHARAAGLIATDLLPFVRHTLARQSMGLRTPLPRVPIKPRRHSANT